MLPQEILILTGLNYCTPFHTHYLICFLTVTIACHLRYTAYYVLEQFPKSDLGKLTVRSRYVWAIKGWPHCRRNNNGEWCAIPTHKSAIKGNHLQQYAPFYMFWCGMNALMEKNEIKMYDKVWMILVSLDSKDPKRAATITSSRIGVRSLSLSP